MSYNYFMEQFLYFINLDQRISKFYVWIKKVIGLKSFELA